MSMQKEIENGVGERLKSVRLGNNYSTNKFAEILGIAQSAITKIENGQSEPSAKTLVSLHEKFGVDPLWILTGKSRNAINSQTALMIAELADILPEESRQRILDITRREVLLEQMLEDRQLKKAGCE